ncbi:Cysteine desulfurase [Komagataella phaffii CBS 7435]|uniref:Cysteine desulfurase n=1 Tax=Komagataella phaffii (strain ATCC 76273 / CBS 7435 / CECT 11047 / NRRL Y-11430 / Wegner 21-1) TaxID=981350 RepID=A0A1G4KQY5_KOMPC|nr:Cysteine desulfurase [Komagataella phaffii CBS 7435]SCV12427.1 Cysteine desulfurase [Komagataella phaffii CBS 7435]
MVKESQAQVLNLYRTFLRYSNNFENYNFRNYFIRKTKDSFRANRSIEEKDIPEFLLKAQKDLQVLKRQSTISQMYHFDKSVVEKLDHDIYELARRSNS